jgi:hypothetical protein
MRRMGCEEGIISCEMARVVVCYEMGDVVVGEFCLVRWIEQLF